MQTQVSYEWCIEFMDDEDITDLNFSNEDKLEFDKSDFDAPEGGTSILCLLRKEGNEADGETDRYYAYVKDGKLPENFPDVYGYETGIKVPQKYQKQLSAYLKTQSA